MKKFSRICCLLLCMLFIIHIAAGVACAQPVETAGNSSVASGSNTADAQIPMLGTAPLVSNVQSAFLYEQNSDTLMYTWNADAPMDPASLVKIMTAYVAVVDGSLDEIVTVDDAVISAVPYDAVSADLLPNEVLTLEQLLYCMMVGSANDAAAVIADHICGSESAFVDRMNDVAATLGCTGTTFVNPHGLYDSAQLTTARDVGKILSAAVKNPDFMNIISATSYTVPATNKSEARELNTGNFLMTQSDMEIYYDARATGGRTGVAQDGTRCLATVAASGNMELICVVMGAASVYKEDGYAVESFGGFNETKQLLDAGFNGYKAVNLLTEGQVLLSRDVENGTDQVCLGVKASASTVLPESVRTTELSYRYTDTPSAMSAPIDKGQVVSSVEIWYGGICVAQADLFAMNSVYAEQRVVVDPIDDGGTDAWIIALWVVLLICVTVAGILLMLRMKNKKRIAKRVRRRPDQRRR